MRLPSLIIFLTFINLSGQIPNTISSTEKIYGLSKFWQEVNYNFIFLDKIDQKMWDDSYKKLIPIVQNTKNDYEYYRELEKFCALLKDGHTSIYFPENIQTKIMTTMFGEYRLFIKNIEGKPIVERVNYSRRKEVPIGSEIIEVNNMPVQQYIKENVIPYISSSTSYILEDISIKYLLDGLEGDTFVVKIKKPNNQIITLSLTHKISDEKEVYPEFKYQKEIFDFKWLDNKIAYLSLNTFGDKKIIDYFIEKLPELAKAKGLVVDLRYNDGGDTRIAKAIFEYLTNDKLIYGAKSTSRLHIPTYNAWGNYFTFTAKDTINVRPEWEMSKQEVVKSYLIANKKYYYHFDYEPEQVTEKEPKIVIPTALLIGHRTASSAEDFLVYADNQKHMIKIGENTFGSTGQPLIIDLPGGGKARICTKKDVYPDGREFVGYGIKPDIEVKLTLKDYLNGKDIVLSKATEIIKKKIQ